MELPTAVSGHDFLQVHIDLLTGRVWLVPTFKTATAEVTIWIVATADIGVFTDIGDKMTRYHVPCYDIGLMV